MSERKFIGGKQVNQDFLEKKCDHDDDDCQTRFTCRWECKSEFRNKLRGCYCPACAKENFGINGGACSDEFRCVTRFPDSTLVLHR